MTTKLYFAYGSNMKTSRMTDRVPSAKPVGYAKLTGNTIAFNKASNDKSGKTNIVDSKNSYVLGVLFEVDEKDIPKLDEFEKGYEKQEVTVSRADNQNITAFIYISTQTNNDLKPYDWYLNLLIDGAEENNLPKDYIDYLRSFESVPDTRKKK
jgi:gamma-glutamylcyclotransferase (GGCT)/AIG2-like uncharacterized protein YtfP